MPRSPKSSSPRWTMPSFFSSGLSHKRASTTRPRRLAITTQKEDSVKESPTPAKKDEAATPDKNEETGPWILLHDRNGRRFLWNKSTGQWTFDGIAIYAPPAPAISVMYSQYWLQQQRQQQQLFSYVQPTVGYYPPPSPYTAVQHQPWQHPPPPWQQFPSPWEQRYQG